MPKHTPVIRQTNNRNCSNLSCHQLNLPDGHEQQTYASWSTVFCIWCDPAAPGRCCRMTFRHGRQCMTTTAGVRHSIHPPNLSCFALSESVSPQHRCGANSSTRYQHPAPRIRHRRRKCCGYKIRKTCETTANANQKNLQRENRRLRLMWHLYIIKQKEQFYTGITTDINNRLRQHDNPPLLYKEAFPNKHQAARRERQIKGFSKAKKLKLITGLTK